MPGKHNQSCSHRLAKPRYKVTNWLDYNAALRRRGDFTIWFSDAAITDCTPANTGTFGRPQEYSYHPIVNFILIRQVSPPPLQLAEGFMSQVAQAMGEQISIPDFSCIPKLSIELPRPVLSIAMQTSALVIVDSNGLKVYGKDDWYQEKHSVPPCGTWRNLHQAVDEYHQILAYQITAPEVGDSTAFANLLDQIGTPFESFIGVGAYDSEEVSQADATKQSNASIVAPPHKTAVLTSAAVSQHDTHIREIKAHGGIAWHRVTRYGLRAHVLLSTQRYKRIVGLAMKARKPLQQKPIHRQVQLH